MSTTFKFLLREPGKSMILVQLRERLLKIMLFSSFVVGTVLFGLAMIPVLQKGLYPTASIYSLLYIWTILITFMQRLPYRVRAIGWLAILYIFGNVNLVNSGFNVDSGLFFITFIAMAVLLMDLTAGLVAIILSSIAVSIMGFLNTGKDFPLPVGLPQSDPLLWIIGGIIFLLMGVLLIYSLTIVVTGLEENLAKTTLLANELKKTNEALRISEARYRTLVNTSPGLVTLLDLNGNVLMANQSGLALFGYEHSEEVVGKNLISFISPDEQLHAAEVFQKNIGAGFKDITFPVRRKDGGSFLGEFSSALVVDETGNPQAVICTGRDVTSHEEGEKLLRDAKEALAEKVVETTDQLKQTAGRLEKLVKHGPTVIYSYRASDHVVNYISENVSALVGYESSELMDGTNFWGRLHPDDKVLILDKVEQGSNPEKTFYDYRFLHKDGTYRWMHDERVLLRDAYGNPLEYIGSWSDITESKNAEEALKNSEAKYRNLYESMMDAYVDMDMEGRIGQFNQAYENMLGYEPDELRKLTYTDLTPEKWHAFETEIIEKQVLPRGFSDIYEKEYIRKDGTIFPVELRTVLIRDEAGHPTGIWAIVRDISERKIIEQTLRDSEARYREVLDNSMQGVIVFQDMRIVYINQAVTEAVGYTQAELKSLHRLRSSGVFIRMIATCSEGS